MASADGRSHTGWLRVDGFMMYNIAVAVAVGLISGGSWLLWGSGYALLITGVVMLALTIYGDK